MSKEYRKRKDSQYRSKGERKRSSKDRGRRQKNEPKSGKGFIVFVVLAVLGLGIYSFFALSPQQANALEDKQKELAYQLKDLGLTDEQIDMLGLDEASLSDLENLDMGEVAQMIKMLDDIEDLAIDEKPTTEVESTYSHPLGNAARLIGIQGDYINTIAWTYENGMIYSIEGNGVMYQTDPKTGEWEKIGKQEYKNTDFLFADDGLLYTIEEDGGFYVTKPKGLYGKTSKSGSKVWWGTSTCAVLNNFMYTVEADGGLYATELNDANWKRLGKANFAATLLMFAYDNKLYSVEDNGGLFVVNPTDGSWREYNSSYYWQDARVGACIDNNLYIINKAGHLLLTDLSNEGEQPKVISYDMKNTMHLLNVDGALYAIDGSGSLIEVDINALSEVFNH